MRRAEKGGAHPQESFKEFEFLFDWAKLAPSWKLNYSILVETVKPRGINENNGQQKLLTLTTRQRLKIRETTQKIEGRKIHKTLSECLNTNGSLARSLLLETARTIAAFPRTTAKQCLSKIKSFLGSQVTRTSFCPILRKTAVHLARSLEADRFENKAIGPISTSRNFNASCAEGSFCRSFCQLWKCGELRNYCFQVKTYLWFLTANTNIKKIFFCIQLLQYYYYYYEVSMFIATVYQHEHRSKAKQEFASLSSYKELVRIRNSQIFRFPMTSFLLTKVLGFEPLTFRSVIWLVNSCVTEPSKITICAAYRRRHTSARPDRFH